MKQEEKNNGCIMLIEGYKNAISLMPDSLGNAKDCIRKQYERLETENDSISVDEHDTSDGNEDYYEVLYRLQLSSNIESCKKAAAMLKDYLINKPGSVMGETMFAVIEEQLEDWYGLYRCNVLDQFHKK